MNRGVWRHSRANLANGHRVPEICELIVVANAPVSVGLREIRVLIVAIMVPERSGSAYTAELGSMKMREEIDALSTMGLNPVEVLILPRVVALVCALPILAFIGPMAALYGGGLDRGRPNLAEVPAHRPLLANASQSPPDGIAER